MLDGMKDGDFVDLFCGGCNLLDGVSNNLKRIANDKNEYLIEMWKALTSGWKPKTTITKEAHNLARKCCNEHNHSLLSTAEIGWIIFMASVNGKFLGGYSGHNVKIGNGKTRDYISESIRNIQKQIPLLYEVDFHYGNYDELDLPPVGKTTIYCDIPYKDTTQYTTSKNFDYDKFYGWCRQKHSEGYRLYISEYQMPDDFKCVWEKQITCAMNQTTTKKPVEKLFTL